MTIFPLAEAERIVQQLTADPDEDWQYRVERLPVEEPRAKIAVYDEDGDFVEYF